MQYLVTIATLLALAFVVASGAELDVDLIWDTDDAIWRLEGDYNTLVGVLGPRMEELQEPETIEGAMKALASLRRKWPQKADGLLGKIGVSAKPPVEAMDLFEELEDAHKKCDYHSFKILKWNFFLAVGRQPERLDSSKSKLHSIVRQAWEQHSATCRPEHLEHFNSLPNSEKVILEQMRNIINKEAIQEIFGTTDLRTILSMKPAEVSERLPKSGKFWVQRTHEVSQGTLGATHLKTSGDEIRLTWAGSKINDWPRQAIETRISNKCAWIFKHIDVFRPVMFDLVLDDEKLQEITKGDELFEHTLAVAKVCPAIIEHKEELISQVRKYLSFF